MPRPGPRPAEGFDHALEQGDLPNAWLYAHDLTIIPLYKALWMTVLIGDQRGGEGYQRACRRFIERLVRERKPTMEQLKKVADALDVLRDPMVPEHGAARMALLDLAERLRGDEPGPRPRGGSWNANGRSRRTGRGCAERRVRRLAAKSSEGRRAR